MLAFLLVYFKAIIVDTFVAVNMFYLPSGQGNKITVLSENLISSLTMVTELNACKYLQFYHLDSRSYFYPYEYIEHVFYLYLCSKKFIEWYTREHWESFTSHSP